MFDLLQKLYCRKSFTHNKLTRELQVLKLRLYLLGDYKKQTKNALKTFVSIFLTSITKIFENNSKSPLIN